jgi:hypothetical protein
VVEKRHALGVCGGRRRQGQHGGRGKSTDRRHFAPQTILDRSGDHTKDAAATLSRSILTGENIFPDASQCKAKRRDFV